MDRSESLIANSRLHSFLFLNVDVKSYQRRYNRQTSLTQRSGIRWSETLQCYCPLRSISCLNCKISLALTIFNARLNRTCMAGGAWKFRSVSRAGHNSVTGKSRVWIAGGFGTGLNPGLNPPVHVYRRSFFEWKSVLNFNPSAKYISTSDPASSFRSIPTLERSVPASRFTRAVVAQGNRAMQRATRLVL